jgi:ssDNA-binding Zn-finger/Zn-ribbon topoisomerase 1
MKMEKKIKCICAREEKLNTLSGRLDELKQQEFIGQRRKRCGHLLLKVEIYFNGIIDGATCAFCGKIMDKRNFWNERRFSGKRIYNLFKVKGELK